MSCSHDFQHQLQHLLAEHTKPCTTHQSTRTNTNTNKIQFPQLSYLEPTLADQLISIPWTMYQTIYQTIQKLSNDLNELKIYRMKYHQPIHNIPDQTLAYITSMLSIHERAKLKTVSHRFYDATCTSIAWSNDPQPIMTLSYKRSIPQPSIPSLVGCRSLHMIQHPRSYDDPRLSLAQVWPEPHPDDEKREMDEECMLQLHRLSHSLTELHLEIQLDAHASQLQKLSTLHLPLQQFHLHISRDHHRARYPQGMMDENYDIYQQTPSAIEITIQAIEACLTTFQPHLQQFQLSINPTHPILAALLDASHSNSIIWHHITSLRLMSPRACDAEIIQEDDDGGSIPLYTFVPLSSTWITRFQQLANILRTQHHHLTSCMIQDAEIEEAHRDQIMSVMGMKARPDLDPTPLQHPQSWRQVRKPTNSNSNSISTSIVSGDVEMFSSFPPYTTRCCFTNSSSSSSFPSSSFFSSSSSSSSTCLQLLISSTSAIPCPRVNSYNEPEYDQSRSRTRQKRQKGENMQPVTNLTLSAYYFADTEQCKMIWDRIFATSINMYQSMSAYRNVKQLTLANFNRDQEEEWKDNAILLHIPPMQNPFPSSSSSSSSSSPSSGCSLFHYLTAHSFPHLSSLELRDCSSASTIDKFLTVIGSRITSLDISQCLFTTDRNSYPCERHLLQHTPNLTECHIHKYIDPQYDSKYVNHYRWHFKPEDKEWIKKILPHLKHLSLIDATVY